MNTAYSNVVDDKKANIMDRSPLLSIGIHLHLQKPTGKPMNLSLIKTDQIQ